MQAQTTKSTLADLRRERARLGYLIDNAEQELAEQHIAHENALAESEAARWLWKREYAVNAESNAVALTESFDASHDGLRAALARKERAAARIVSAKHSLDDAEAMVLLNGAVDGKNAELRKAQLTVALRADPAHEAATHDLAAAERDADEANADILLIERRLDAVKVHLRILAATLELLAS